MSDQITEAFTRRLIADLRSNNTLRGAWAEQLVAHFLGCEDRLAPNWSYWDMRDRDGRDVSVKHSVGPKPRFSVEMSEWAWDPGRAGADSAPGWYTAENNAPQYWCHTYVFAWLEAVTAEPPLEHILEPVLWRFAVHSRESMYACFSDNGRPGRKTASRDTLAADFHPGTELLRLVAATPLVADADLTPPRSMIQSIE